MKGDPGPDLLLREASILERAGDFAAAEAAYQRVLKQWPNLPETWYNLAVLQRKSNRFEASLASYEQALRRGVSKPEEVHLNRGVIYSDYLRRDDAAEAELNQALALNPQYIPALLNLGNLQEDLGRREAAEAAYEKILVIEPAYFEALARLGNLRASAGPGDEIVGRLRAAIADPRATPADRASLGFALGKVLDGGGAYDDAFAAYRSANEQSRLSSGRRGSLYDRVRQEKYVDQLIEVFGARQTAVASRRGAHLPIFICGMFRSGSTLAEQVLAGHSRVTSGGELPFLPELAQTRFAPYPASVKSATAAKLDEAAALYLDALRRTFPAAQRLTDKRPDNFQYIGLIKSLFPDARIVHTRRDALDNCLSIFFLHLDHRMGYALDLEDIGHYYREYRRLMAHWKSLYGEDILDFDYDDFVREPRPAVEKLLAFCGLEWEEGTLDFNRVKNAVKTASVWQVREPLYQRSSGRAKHYERQLDALKKMLSP